MENNHKSAKVSLPPIPAKRYFTIGEVSELCGVKPHVLRYWEQEFTQLRPVKRRGNRLDESMRERSNHREKAAEAPAPLDASDFARIRREISGVLEYLSA